MHAIHGKVYSNGHYRLMLVSHTNCGCVDNVSVMTINSYSILTPFVRDWGLMWCRNHLKTHNKVE